MHWPHNVLIAQLARDLLQNLMDVNIGIPLIRCDDREWLVLHIAPGWSEIHHSWCIRWIVCREQELADILPTDILGTIRTMLQKQNSVAVNSNLEVRVLLTSEVLDVKTDTLVTETFHLVVDWCFTVVAGTNT
jgi:hypothetical protein